MGLGRLWRAGAPGDLSNPEQLTLSGEPKVRVAFRLFAHLGIRHVFLENRFEFRERFHFVLHHNLIEFAGQISEKSEIPQISRGCNFLHLSNKLSCLSGFGGKRVANDNHSITSEQRCYHQYLTAFSRE
jgi:hypothetical protein